MKGLTASPNPNPDKPELNIEDLWYRFAQSFLLKSVEQVSIID
jgi:hypothetical protein